MSEWTLPYPPGMHLTIPAPAYHALDAANASFLKHFDRSPLHAHYERTHPKESDALDLGQALHTLVLEPEAFEEFYAAAPKKLDRRFKEAKAEWAAFEAANAGKVVLTLEQYQAIVTMGVAVSRHPVAARLLSEKALHEPTLLWRDELTGLACKARPDILVSYEGTPTLADLKSCANADERSFSRSVAEYRYDVQASFYLHGADVLAPVPRRFMFIAVESAPPHGVQVYELESVWLEYGEATWRHALNVYAECLESGHWPGYSPRVRSLAPPAWVTRRLEE